MAKTTTITREYNHEGRVVKETIVESGEAGAFDNTPAPVRIAPPPPGGGSTFPPYVYPSITTNPPYGGWPPGTITC